MDHVPGCEAIIKENLKVLYPGVVYEIRCSKDEPYVTTIVIEEKAVLQSKESFPTKNEAYMNLLSITAGLVFAKLQSLELIGPQTTALPICTDAPYEHEKRYTDEREGALESHTHINNIQKEFEKTNLAICLAVKGWEWFAVVLETNGDLHISHISVGGTPDRAYSCLYNDLTATANDVIVTEGNK